MKDNKILKYMQAAEQEQQETQNEKEPEVEVSFFSSIGNEVTEHIKKLFSKNDGKTGIVSQEFFGFGKKEEQKQKGIKCNMAHALVTTTFNNKSFLSECKSFCSFGAGIIRRLLKETNDKLNKDSSGSAFNKCSLDVNKGLEEYKRHALKLEKHVVDFLKELKYDNKEIEEIKKDGIMIALQSKYYDEDGMDSMVCYTIDENGDITDNSVSSSKMLQKFNELSETEKEKLIDKAIKQMSSVDYCDKTGVWNEYDKLYKEFNKGIYGDSMDNLNDKLMWFYSIADQGIYGFKLDLFFPERELKNAIGSALGVVSQEFLGFGKKYKILSNVDFEASLKQSEISKRYDSVNELKEALSVLSIFENDVCECLSRNNDGFSIEFDPEEVVYALKDIKQGDGPSEFLKVLKSLKTKSSFEEMKEVNSDVYEREFSIEKGQQSINYYKNDCLNVIDNCYKNSENDPKHKNTVNRIKEFVKIGEAEIKAAEECLQLLFKYIKVEKA